MYWMLLPLRRYADFDGRSRRLEYWMFQLFIWLVFGACAAFAIAVGGYDTVDPVTGMQVPPSPLFWIPVAAITIFSLGIIVPGIAVTIRRLHDRNMSGWFYLLVFIPYLGGLILFVITLLPGTPGENRFGDDPINPDRGDLDQVFR